jgi:hypothetical protein
MNNIWRILACQLSFWTIIILSLGTYIDRQNSWSRFAIYCSLGVVASGLQAIVMKSGRKKALSA